MIVVLEGIDGAGKSTLAPRLRDRMAPGYQRCFVLDKQTLRLSDAAPDAHIDRLRKLIWRDDENDRDVFGPRHWIALIAAWYHAVYASVLQSLEPAAELAIVDGWYYRNLIKTRLRLETDAPELAAMFASIPPPDHVVLIDVDPEIAWKTRTGFKTTEIGRWDGQCGSPCGGFVAYQSQIRAGLLADARDLGWQVIERTAASDPGVLIDSIVAGLPDRFGTRDQG